ncbi:unnamed protein product [Schistosoma rodhaini]|nr:unnamed protein product [Schistosoma rodhaini]
MDEYLGLSHDHPQSYHYYMYHNFFKHIDIDPKNVHILNGITDDPEAECEMFEMEIKKAGGIHLFVGGIGPDGHIAFNEPGSSLASRTRVKTLAKETVVANARFFGDNLSQISSIINAIFIILAMSQDISISILQMGFLLRQLLQV